jgi:hypothetical protein
MTETPRICREAGDDSAHQKRPAPFPGPRCYSCHHHQKRTQKRSGRLGVVRRLYGLSEDDLRALVAAQRGRCAGCGRRVGVVKAGAVDHDHALGNTRAAVRGILCSTCNRFLGYVRDDPQTLVRLALYLIDPPARKVLDNGGHPMTGLDT